MKTNTELRACGAAMILAALLPGIARAGPAASVAPASRWSPPLLARPFKGTIRVAVDATDTNRGILSATETIPVQTSGDVVLLYPEWETASHAPTVPVAALAGLTIAIDGRRVEWRRDPQDVHAFHVTVPAGAKLISINLQNIAERETMNDDLVNLPWQRVLLYPAGWSAHDLPVAARVRLPLGLKAYTSLDLARRDGDVASFGAASLERVVDAPLFASASAREVDLAPGSDRPVRLIVLGRDEKSLVPSHAEVVQLRALVAAIGATFGPAPFRHYDAIVVLDDALSAGGVEHLEEGENYLPTSYFARPADQLNNLDLIAHELIHAWNGRFRQPADLWTPTFNEPVSGSLLWVYEGQTEFWGRMMAARSGMRSREQSFDKLALDAALVANRPGRAWKSLADSTNDAVYMAGHRVVWRDWQRREDYYPEGVLLWIDVDARLRELTHGRAGLDAFASRFFHAGSADGAVSTYTFEDVCRTLNTVAHDDWSTFLRAHLDSHDDAAALAGLERSGWRLTYTADESAAYLQAEAENGGTDLSFSIGLVVRDNGQVATIAWGGPAFKAGIMPGDRITSVDRVPFSSAALIAAVRGTARAPLRLGLASGSKQRDAQLDYRGGLRYPHLQRVPGRTDWLSQLLNRR